MLTKHLVLINDSVDVLSGAQFENDIRDQAVVQTLVSFLCDSAERSPCHICVDYVLFKDSLPHQRLFSGAATDSEASLDK